MVGKASTVKRRGAMNMGKGQIAWVDECLLIPRVSRRTMQRLVLIVV